MNRSLLQAKLPDLLRLAKYIGLKDLSPELSLEQLADEIWWEIIISYRQDSLQKTS